VEKHGSFNTGTFFFEREREKERERDQKIDRARERGRQKKRWRRDGETGGTSAVIQGSFVDK